jgi:hypothetical protein
MNYYTYAYLREDGTPYYIGKGTGTRAFYKYNSVVSAPLNKDRIIFLKQNLTEEDAFRHEIYLISVLGRKDLGTGILRNRTDGGEGTSGKVFTEDYRRKLSEASKRQDKSYLKGENNPACRPEIRAKISASVKEYYRTHERTEAQKNNKPKGGGVKGRVQPPDEKAKQIAAQTGMKRKPHTKEAKQKMREAALRRYGKLP